MEGQPGQGKEPFLFCPEGFGTEMQLYAPLKIVEVQQLTGSLVTPGFHWLVHLEFIHTASAPQEDFGKSNLSPCPLVLRDIALDVMNHISEIGVSSSVLQRWYFNGPLKKKEKFFT